MSFRSQQMVKKIVKKLGGEKNLMPGTKESIKKCLPDSKVVMGRAHRGLYACRHIHFGNHVSEKGGNTCCGMVTKNKMQQQFFEPGSSIHVSLVTPTQGA